MKHPIFELLLCIALISFYFFGLINQYLHEKRKYNRGICPKCGSKLKCFDMDSSGAYGFTCPECDHTAWVSFESLLKQ